MFAVRLDDSDLQSRESFYLEDPARSKHPHAHHCDDGVDEGEAVDEFEVEDGQHSLVCKDDAASHSDIEYAVHYGLNMSL